MELGLETHTDISSIHVLRHFSIFNTHMNANGRKIRNQVCGFMNKKKKREGKTFLIGLSYDVPQEPDPLPRVLR
jgi:hypothetical protein